MPNEFYQPIIAATFGTVTHAMFPVTACHDADTDVLAVSGMDTLELVGRLQRSDLDEATLAALSGSRPTACAASTHTCLPTSSASRVVAGCAAITQFRGQRLTLKQHRDILVQAGWITLLIGCVEYDTGDRQAAETTRQAALSLGAEADHAEIQAWAHEMRAWMNLTTGDYHGVVAAARQAPMLPRTQRRGAAGRAGGQSVGTHR